MKGFWQSVFSEPNGPGSYARVASAALLLASIAWISWIVVRTNAIPPVAEVIALMSAPYAMNRAAGIIDSITAQKKTDS